jgi:hypothetical protein
MNEYQQQGSMKNKQTRRLKNTRTSNPNTIYSSLLLISRTWTKVNQNWTKGKKKYEYLKRRFMTA